MKKVPPLKPYDVTFARDRKTANTPDSAAEFFRLAGLHEQPVEVVMALYLNSANKAIRLMELSRGSVDVSIVHPREVLLPAVECRATTFIIAHNHPSGGVRMSSDDIELSKRMHRCGDLIGIQMLDHLVVADDGYGGMEYESYREKGY